MSTERRTVSGGLLQFVLYSTNGVLSALVYSLVAWAMIVMAGAPLTADVITAYAASVLWNYLGSRWIFGPAEGFAGHGLRYAAIVVLSLTLTASFAWACDRLDLPTLVAVYLPPVLTTIPTFLLLRGWVFR